MLRHFKLTFEYDGGRFCGWQSQRGQTSVEACMRQALAKVVAAPLSRWACAGRTDAGVHATGQVISFSAAYRLEARRLAPALNHVLPPDIRVHLSEEVPDTFNARLDSTAKHYRYHIYSGPHAIAWGRQNHWHVRCKVDVGLMQTAARHLLGHHDFESFRSAHCDAAHARRSLFSVNVYAERRPPVGTSICIDFIGNAFCRHMCRILAGTLLEVGAHRRSSTSVQEALVGRRRALAGVTAPACGLTLLEVFYEKTFALPAPDADAHGAGLDVA